LQGGSTYAEYTTAIEQYAKFTISPRCLKVDTKLCEKLCPQFDDKLFLAFDDPVPENREELRVDREVNLSTGMTTINEERAKIGLEPTEWGDQPFIPSNMIPLSEMVSDPEKVIQNALDRVSEGMRKKYVSADK